MIVMRVQREPSDLGTTFGALYINDLFICWTLEDAIRETPGVAFVKVPGGTAIPAGRYDVALEWSPRFQMKLPELKGVPHFSEVKFHAGNAPADTEGCILVGLNRSNVRTLQMSRRALDVVLTRLNAMPGEAIVADILNPPGLHLGHLTPPARPA